MLPRAPGDLCDATEIEEILTLRILTLTDEEKAEVRDSEERARSILERAETLPAEHLMRLHGTIRGLAPADAGALERLGQLPANLPVQALDVDGDPASAPAIASVSAREARADIFDTALQGRVAIIAGIEQDFEEQGPRRRRARRRSGRDLGEMRQIGHRFFFSPGRN